MPKFSSLILDLIYPPLCYGCHRPGSYLCPLCHQEIVINSIKSTKIGKFEGILSLYPYNGSIRDLIKALKFDFVSDLADEISGYIANDIRQYFPNLLDYWQMNNFCLVPIPLHRHRQNWRGFNQSEIIGQQIASHLKLNYDHSLFVRSKSSSPQSSIHHRQQRQANLSNSFTLTSHIPPQNIILFDDVYTTGSTLKSASHAFSNSPNFWGLTIAG